MKGKKKMHAKPSSQKLQAAAIKAVRDGYSHVFAAKPENPLDGVVTNPTSAGPIPQMLFELGRKRALENGATEPREG